MTTKARLSAIGIALIASLMVFGTQAKAAFVTTQEVGMDLIFSQPSFGANPIDIRFGPIETVVRPDLLNITTDAQIIDVFNLFGGSPTVNFYYVDTVDSCGGFNVNIVGCGAFPGNDFVVESSFAASPVFGAELLAHELGHNLGLDHVATGLMAPVLNGDTTLTASEVATVLASPLVQSDINGLFIDVRPILILAEDIVAVPLPASVLMLLGGLVFLGGIGKRRSRIKA